MIGAMYYLRIRLPQRIMGATESYVIACYPEVSRMWKLEAEI